MEINYVPAGPTIGDFHRSDAFVRGLMGPFGCVGPEVRVVTEYGLLPMWRIDRPMRVLSWRSDGGRDRSGSFEFAWCGGSFPKGIGRLRRIVTRSGEFAGALHHRIFCADGSYRRLGELRVGDRVLGFGGGPGVLGVPLGKGGEVSPSVYGVGAQRLMGRRVDCLGGYAGLARQYGLRLLEESGIDLEYVRRLGGVRRLFLFFDLVSGERGGDFAVRSRGRIRLGLFGDRICTDDFLALVGRHGLGRGGCVSGGPFGRSEGTRLGCERSLLTSADRLPGVELPLGTCGGVSSELTTAEGAIISIEDEEVNRSYWDMQVLDTNNYVTEDGVIHHNSGKSTACVHEMLHRAVEMTPGKDGVRRSRWLVVRNTYPELKSTTIKSWHEAVPQGVGHWRGEGPPTHVITGDKFEMTVEFVSMDRVSDLKKLLSMNLTGAWLNEVRELDYEIVSGVTGRVGRYYEGLGEDQRANWAGVLMDTNPPDTDHWYYLMAEGDETTDRGRELHATRRMAERTLRSSGFLADDQPLYEFFRQPGGLLLKNGELVMNPAVENQLGLGKHPMGVEGYYLSQAAGKSMDWIRVYAMGQYGFVRDGLVVYPDFTEEMHVSAVEPVAKVPVHIGIDFGMTPAAVFAQKVDGVWNIVREIVHDRASVPMLAESIVEVLEREFGDCPVGTVTGDPSGNAGQSGDKEGRTCFEIMKALGVEAKPARSNDPTIRIGAVEKLLRGHRRGSGLIRINKATCPVLYGGFAGKYRYRRSRTGTGYMDKPDKNSASHVHDALQYLALGAGEGKSLVTPSNEIEKLRQMRYGGLVHGSTKPDEWDPYSGFGG